MAADDAYSTAKDTALSLPAPGVLGNDRDPEGEALSAAVAAGPANGSVALNSDGGFTYTPNPTFTGTDTFTYTASDPKGDSDAAEVTITVGSTTRSDLIVTAAGNGTAGFSGDGGSAVRARLGSPVGLAGDAAGNLYVSSEARIRKIDTSGVITTIAGTGTGGNSGDGGFAAQAQVSAGGIDAAPNGDLYFTAFIAGSSGTKVRRIDAASGIIDTVVGTGVSGYSGEGGPAKAAQLHSSSGYAFDSKGNLYIGDIGNHRVRKVTPGADGVVDGDDDEIITTIAGTGVAGYSGDESAATLAQLNRPLNVKMDRYDNLYISDFGNRRIRRVDTAGVIKTVALNGNTGYSGEGGPAMQASFSLPLRMAIDAAGVLYLTAGSDARVVKIVPGSSDDVVDGDEDEILTPVAGLGGRGYAGDDGPASQSVVSIVHSLVVDPSGSLFLSDQLNHRIRRVGPIGPLRLTTSDSPDPVAPGGTLTYTLAVKNLSAGPATNVALTDSLPGGTTFESVTAVDQGTCTQAAGTVECALGEVRGGATATVLVKAKVPDEPTTLTSRATVRSAEADAYAADNIAVETTAVTDPDLAVTLRDSPDPVAVGGELTYTATVTNSGPGPATGISLTDSLPPGTTFRSGGSSAGPCSESSGKVSCALGGLAAGTSTEVTITVSAPSQPTTLTNTATVAATEADPAPANNTATVQTAVTPPVNLSVTTDDTPEPATAGQPLDYVLTVTNEGTVDATRVVVTNTMPEGVTFVAAVAAHDTGTTFCSPASRVVTCRLPDLPPGAAAKVTITVTPPNTDLLSNTATVKSAQPEATPANNTDVEQTVVSTTGTPAGLGLATVDRPNPVAVGQPLTYEFTVTNGAAIAATDVVLTETLPAGVSFGSARADQGSCSHSGGTVTCNLGTVNPGAYVGAEVTVVTSAEGTLTNTASVSSTGATGATSTATTTISPTACGQVITEDTVLMSDIGPCAGPGIVVGADGITLDLGGHRVFGTPGPSDPAFNGGIVGNQPGVFLLRRSNVTVKNGTITDFDAGVFLRGGGSNTVTGLTLRDNIGPASNDAELGDGIAVFNSADNRIVGNTITHNGNFDGIGVLGGGSDGNVIENNIVEDTVAQPGASQGNDFGQGIVINAAAISYFVRPQTIVNTRVVGNVVRRNGSAGISNVGHYDGVIMGNTIENNGGINGPANGIGVQTGPEGGRSTNLVIQSNHIHGNFANGIHIFGGTGTGVASGNKVLNNDVADNNKDIRIFGGYKDLLDSWGECSSNTWSGNIAGSGGASPACTAAPDATPPETTIVSGPTGPITDDKPTFEFTSPEPASRFECRFDTAAFAPCTSPHTASGLAEGAHSFEVRTTDPANNTDPTPAIRSFAVDRTPPETSITSGPSGPTSDDTPSFEFSSSEAGSSFACRVDGGEFAPCTSPYTTAVLDGGPHSFEVAATDAAGNADPTPATRSFVVDATAPETTITSGPTGETTDDTPTFEFSSSEEGSSFACRVDGGAFGPCTSPHTTAKLAVGPHTFEVAATDPAGNADATPASASFSVTSPAGFSLSASPPSQTLEAGTSTSYAVSVTPTGGFAGSVDLAASGLPSGATATFSPNPTTGSSTMAVSTEPSTPAGTYTVTISGTSGSLSHQTTVTLTVTAPPPPPGFSLSASPPSQTVVAGKSTSYSVSVTYTGGFSGSVKLSASGLPAGASATFSPNPTTGSSTMTVSTKTRTKAGTYTVTIKGASGKVTSTTTVQLTVTK